MVSATSWAPGSYECYTFPHSQWSAEIRFPIRQTPGYSTRGGGYPTSHGGLTDADPVRQEEWDRYDPSKGDAGPGRPRYWWVNFARAEHPKKYTYADGSYDICPMNCTAEAEHAVNVTAGYPTPPGGASLAGWPTLLGSYWEWVWGPVGDANPGVGYMHWPSSFPQIQFADASGAEPLCRNIEFPGRHVAKSLHLAQTSFAKYHNGSYTANVTELLNATLCNLDLGTSDTCDLDALLYATGHPEVFKLGMTVTDNITAITRACPTRPCYMASGQVPTPGKATAKVAGQEGGGTGAAAPYAYTARINSNRDTVVQHDTPTMAAPCL